MESTCDDGSSHRPGALLLSPGRSGPADGNGVFHSGWLDQRDRLRERRRFSRPRLLRFV